jgi:hypothetical protein
MAVRVPAGAPDEPPPAVRRPLAAVPAALPHPLAVTPALLEPRQADSRQLDWQPLPHSDGPHERGALSWCRSSCRTPQAWPVELALVALQVRGAAPAAAQQAGPGHHQVAWWRAEPLLVARTRAGFAPWAVTRVGFGPKRLTIGMPGPIANISRKTAVSPKPSSMHNPSAGVLQDKSRTFLSPSSDRRGSQ